MSKKASRRISMSLGADYSSATTLGPRQAAILNVLFSKGPMTYAEIKESMGDSYSSLANLIRRGVVSSRRSEGELRFSLTTKASLALGEQLSRVQGLGDNLGLVVTGVKLVDPTRQVPSFR